MAAAGMNLRELNSTKRLLQRLIAHEYVAMESNTTNGKRFGPWTPELATEERECKEAHRRAKELIAKIDTLRATRKAGKTNG